MKPDDRALKNYVKDVCSNINKGIFQFDYGYAILKEKGIIKKQLSGVKVLATGNLEKKLTVKANRFSSVAVSKIEAAGGTTEVI